MTTPTLPASDCCELVRTVITRLKRIHAVVGLEINALEHLVSLGSTKPASTMAAQAASSMIEVSREVRSAVRSTNDRARPTSRTWTHTDGSMTIVQAIADALKVGPRTKAEVTAHVIDLIRQGKTACKSEGSIDGPLSKGQGELWMKRGFGASSMFWLVGSPAPIDLIDKRTEIVASPRAAPRIVTRPAPCRTDLVDVVDRNDAIRDAIDAGTRDPLSLEEAIEHVLSDDVGEGLDAWVISVRVAALDRLGMVADGIKMESHHVHEILYRDEGKRYTRDSLGKNAKWRLLAPVATSAAVPAEST